MFDFGAFCYLDVQKTGSSFVLDVLTRHSARPLNRSVRHGRVRWPEPEGGDPRLYFITCRDPVAQWRSLYFYGCDGQGALFHFLRRTQPDTAALYDRTEAGLNAWLARLLDPGFAPAMPEQYDRTCPALYGFQTVRFLLLSFRRPVMRLRSLTTRADLIAAYEAERLHAHVLRTESLNDDLAALIRGPLAPHIRDVDAACADLARGRRLNVSSHAGAGADIRIDPALHDLIRRREWFFYDMLGYG